jgi:hypothetical protein
MAVSFPWMEAAYKGVMDWTVSNDQANPDRGTYKDALQSSTASKFVDYELSKGLMSEVADSQTRVMEADTKNTKDLMAAEHGFKLSGMEKSNELSKDYLGAETESDIAKTRVTGQEQREGIRTTADEERRNLDHRRQGDFTLARSGLRR